MKPSQLRTSHITEHGECIRFARAGEANAMENGLNDHSEEVGQAGRKAS